MLTVLVEQGNGRRFDGLRRAEGRGAVGAGPGDAAAHRLKERVRPVRRVGQRADPSDGGSVEDEPDVDACFVRLSDREQRVDDVRKIRTRLGVGTHRRAGR